MRRAVLLLCIVAVGGSSAGQIAWGERKVASKRGDSSPLRRGFGPPPGAKRLSRKYDLWVDAKRKQVLMDGVVCLREGPLEMFACTRGSKEHESIVSIHTRAYLVHAALLSVGARQGKPVQFDPKYAPASGSEIEIRVMWFDERGKRQEVRAQEWIKDYRTGKPMDHPWVFAGSGFWTDEVTKKEYYQAESGDFICVSNFPSAMLDLPVESTKANDGLVFGAFTKRIPPLDTKVRVALIPKLDKKLDKKKVEIKKPLITKDKSQSNPKNQ